eukprot:6120859-Pyramimonas_sp.AAC.1
MTSKIDHIAIPSGALPDVRRCTALRGVAKQAFADQSARAQRPHLGLAIGLDHHFHYSGRRGQHRAGKE